SLIAMRPDAQLAGLLGLTSASSTLSNKYLQVNNTSAAGRGLTPQTIQFHGAADLYTNSGASTVALLFSDANTPTANPAGSLRSLGPSGGQAAAFTFDLAQSVVWTRQGNPAWAGQLRDTNPGCLSTGALPCASGVSLPKRAYDLYFGNASFDPEP